MNPWDADAQVQAPSMPWDDDLASHVNPQQRAVVTANDNADAAAKAITVGKKLNVPPTVVQSDLPGYEAHQRTQSAVSAVQNEFIAKYIGNNPMASQVSSDDYEKLDEVSQYLQNLKEDKVQGTSWLKAVQNIPEIGGMLASGPGRQKLLDAAMELPGTLLKGIVDWAAVPGKVLSGEVQLGTKEGLNEALGFGLGAALGMKSAGAKVEGGVSVRPTPDEIRAATAEHASESLTKAIEVAQESKTKVRSPETFAEFTNAHEGGSVFIPAEAIAELYQKEGKAPAEGDGLFGFVPDIARRVELARETGAEVEIPMGDYIAHVDPTVHEGLKDNVRLHESGVTVEEANPEQITSAAVRVGGNTYEGVNHGEAIENAAKALNLSVDKITGGKLEDAGGFVTSQGRYVLREEASKIAESAGQGKMRQYGKGWLAAQDLVEPKKTSTITVYHGSPFDFEAFDLSKIGEGEGAQAFGHGFYFAENPEVARIYKERLASKKAPMGGAGAGQAEIRHEGGMWNVYVDGAIENAFSTKSDAERFINKGNLYKVEISAHPDQFLDWDAPYKGSPLEKIIGELPELPNRSPMGTPLVPRRVGDVINELTHGELAGNKGAVSADLQKAGFAGIKYLDQGSRGKGEEGTRNYVVFDPSILKIIDKNEKPIPQAAVPAVAATAKVKQSLYLNQLFKDAKSIGITEPEFKKYSDKIERAEEAVLDKAVGLAAREAKKRIEPAWRENEMHVRAEVEAEFNRTGPYAAERFIKDEKVNLENAADDIAPSFGFETGAELTDALKTLEGDRLATGKGPAWQLKNAVKDETARRMEERFGNLNEIISDEAWENALAEHTFDILADEVRILADKAGVKPPVGRQELTQWVKDQFQTAKVGELKSTEWLRRAVEKGGREAEKALLGGKLDVAFQAKQRQMLAAITLKEAQKFEGIKRIAERQFDRVTNEEAITSVDREYLEQARGMLEAVGVEQRFRTGTGLPKFVAQSEGQLAVASWLTDGSRPPKMDNLSVAQYRELSDSIKSMIHVGRQAKTLDSAQGKALIDNVMVDLNKELSRFELIHDPQNAGFWQKVKQRPGGMLRFVTAPLTLAETVLDYTDKYNPKGPLTTYLDRPLRDANSTELKLREMVVSRLRDLRKYTDSSVNDRIANDLIPDSRDKSGFYAMDRGNLRQLILNMGNRSNIKKLAEGYNVNEADLRRFIWNNAKEADYRWAQGVWDIFAKLRPLEEDLALRDTGVALDSIEASPLNTPHGEFRGGYFPAVYDSTRSNISADIRAKEGGTFDKFYRNVMPSHGYTESRTGYKGFVDLSGDLLPSRIQTAVHDIAFREAIRQANKIINHPGIPALQIPPFHEIIGQKWGEPIAKMFPNWIKDIANVHSFDDDFLRGFARVAAGIRQNIVSTLISLGTGTFLKHGGTALAMSIERVGFSDLAKAGSDLGFTSAINAAKDLLVRTEQPTPEFVSAFKDATLPNERGEAVRQFILESSPVMRNRKTRYEDSIRGAYERSSEDNALQTMKNLRHWAMDFGRAPVAFSDAVSANPTWLAAYKKAIGEGSDHRDAVFVADKEVSRAHGSNFVGDKPAIMRTDSEALKWLVPLYNFWNHMLNRQLTLAWDMSAAGNEPNSNIPSITRRLFWLTAIPTLVEEMAAPALSDDHHYGIGMRALLALGRQTGSYFPGIREITNGVLDGYEPSVGLLSYGAKEIIKNRENLLKTFQGKKTSDSMIHAFNALGILTGVGGQQLGKTTSFLTDLATGKEQPRSFDEWRQGLRTGHSKVRRH